MAMVEGPQLLPAFLRLRKVVLVGGGAMATAKLTPLLRAGARVTRHRAA